MNTRNTNLALLAAGGGLLFWTGASNFGTLTNIAGFGLAALAAHRMKSKVGFALVGAGLGWSCLSRIRRGPIHLAGAADHPGLGPSMAIQEAAWKSQPNAEKMYPWDLIFSQPTVASGEFDPYVGAPPSYGPPPSYGAQSGGNPTGGQGNPTSTEVRSPTRTRTATEVRSPTSTSTEVRSPTSTSTEVRSPTSTSTEAFTADNFTATVTGGAGAGANTTVTINVTPPSHMADGVGHTSHVGVVPPQEEQYQNYQDPYQGYQAPYQEEPQEFTGYEEYPYPFPRLLR